MSKFPDLRASAGRSASGANLVNALLFQAAWFACVLGGAAGSSLWGAGAVIALVVFAMMRDRWRSDLVLGFSAALVGFALDTAWIGLGVLDYAGAAVAPAWIVLLWAGVGLTVNHSLSPFVVRPWIGGLLAGLSAPLSYLGGERLGAVLVPDPPRLVLVTVAWCAIFTLGFATVRALGERIASEWPAGSSSVRTVLAIALGPGRGLRAGWAARPARTRE